MATSDQAQKKAADTYNAASDSYDHPANLFWERFGRATVVRLNLPSGAHVLDVCCGSGASAIPAAEMVGPQGSVLGVDLAENLLDLARKKAQQRSLKNIDFREADMLALGLPAGSFDAVVCVFGIFFVPEMQDAMRGLWRLVRSGGKLAITTWGPRFFEPASSIFWDSVRALRPDLYKGFNPWDRISDPEAVRRLFPVADVRSLEVVAEPGVHALQSADDWWPMVLGTGYRGTVDQLSAAHQAKVRQQNLDSIRQANIHSVEANVVYAVARRS
jgi:ubiquinone/menaquinone biosynthesis C-methylase UbiE